MARGSRIVDVNQVVQDVDEIYIAYNGQSMQIGEGYVAAAGVVRQFWPPTIVSQSGIVMDTASEVSFAFSEAPAKAICNYNAQDGKLYLSSWQEDKAIQCVSPPPRGQGIYLFKFDVISGDITGSPTGTWEDVNSDGTVGIKEYYLENTTTGSIAAQATVSFAEDDGGGSPVPGSIVTKTIDFTAEVIGQRITMTTAPWSLSNTEVNETAEVFIVVVPDGWYDPINEVTLEYPVITGEFGHPKGVQVAEVYANNWTPAITVQVDVVSGSVTGSATGVPLTTDERRIWGIAAETEGNVSATVDVTISDGVETVTKRVTMYAEQKSESVDPGSEIDHDFLRYDEIIDESIGTPYPIGASAFIRVASDGYVYATRLELPDPTGFPQKWNTLAGAMTDPQNFECRAVVSDGDTPTTGTMNQWFNLSSDHRWGYSARIYGGANDPIPGTTRVEKGGKLRIEVREVGRPETLKIKIVYLEAIARTF